MKTNVSIELNDQQRSTLAALLDGKSTKRLASRKEVVALCEQHIGGLVAKSDPILADDAPDSEHVAAQIDYQSDLYTIDPGDRALMAHPDNPSYVRGWNLAKRSKQK